MERLQLPKHKNAKRNLIVVTHNTCMEYLVKASGNQKSRSPEHGSVFFAAPTSENETQLIRKLNSADLPEQTMPI